MLKFNSVFCIHYGGVSIFKEGSTEFVEYRIRSESFSQEVLLHVKRHEQLKVCIAIFYARVQVF